jgi:hypothetical protein
MAVPRPFLAQAVVALALAWTTAGGAAAGTPVTTTADRVGDGRGAPDICAVSVASNGAAVGFRLTFADRPALKPGERVSLVLDADPGTSSGNPHLAGADLLLSYGIAGEETFAPELLRWARGRWELVPEQRSRMAVVAGDGVLRVALDRRLFGARRFGWSAFTFQAGRGRGSDSAPDGRIGSYAPRAEASPGGAALRSVFGAFAERHVCGPPSRRS